MTTAPVSPADRAAALARLAAIADALAALHAGSQVQGVLDPSAVDGATLIPSDDAPVPRLLARAADDALALVDVAHVAPEVLRGEAPTPQSDVYALAALAIRLLGGAPAVGFLKVGLIARHPSLTAALSTALSSSPAERPTAASFAAVLREVIAASPPVDDATPGHERPTRGVDAQEPHAEVRPFGNQPYRPSAARASEMSGLLKAVLVVGGFFVFTGALWLGFKGWSYLSEVGRFLALLGLTGGVGIGGVASRAKGWPATGNTLIVTATQLLWADAAYAIDVWDLGGDEPWVIASAGVFLATFAAAGAADLIFLAVLSALDAAICAGFVGSWLHSGTPMGPSFYCLLVAVAYAAVALVGHRWRGPRLGGAHAFASSLALFLSGTVAFERIARVDPEPLAIAWPYLIGALALGARRFLPPPYRGFASWVAGAAAFVPTLESLARLDDAIFEAVAVAAGLVALGAAFTIWDDEEHPNAQALALVLGLFHTLAVPLLQVMRVADTSQDATVPLAVALGLSAGLVVLGVGATGRASRAAHYRLVEACGALCLLGVPTLLSWAHWQGWFYAGLALGLGLVVLLAGVFLERLLMSTIAAAFLVVNAWVQYFIRLWDALPPSVVLIGFGLGLLAMGFFYERKLKRLVPTLKAWA